VGVEGCPGVSHSLVPSAIAFRLFRPFNGILYTMPALNDDCHLTNPPTNTSPSTHNPSHR
jgi:hypothetical protein